MNTLRWRWLAWLPLLLLLAAAGAPFTEWGSRVVLDKAGLLLPLEIEYGGGTLAGELQLERLSWSGGNMRLDLQGAVLELAPGCLWRSSLCFRQLSGRQLAVTLLPEAAGDPGSPDTATDEEGFEFPVPVEARNLQLAALSVRWDTGEWLQGPIEAAVRLSGSTITVERALVREARLELRDGGDAGGPVELPEIRLPLALLVHELVLEQPGWDLVGSAGRLDSLRLDGGEWREEKLRLDKLQLRSSDLGHWQAAVAVEFSGQWPLTLEGDGVLPEIQGWPAALERAVKFGVRGDLAALALQAEINGEPALSASGLLNTLDPTLPFRLSAKTDSPQAVALSQFFTLPESLAMAEITAPLRLEASGSLEQQVFQLDTSVSVPGYSSLDVRLAGSHEPGRVALEDLRLQDAERGDTLWGSGEIGYGEKLRWSVLLESSGLDLTPLAEYGNGRVEGQLRLVGEFADRDWTISVVGAELEGTFNGLPLRLDGFAGIDSRLQLLPSDMQAEVNGARLLFQAYPDKPQPGRLDIELDNLGSWLEGGHGSLSLQTVFAPGWEQFSITGSLRELKWQGVHIAGGTIEGDYRPSEQGNFRLGLSLADLAGAGVRLDKAQFSARGDSATQVVSLQSRGEIDGVLELAGKAGPDGSWAGQLAATVLETSEGNWYLDEPVPIDLSPSPARLRLAAHCWRLGQTRVCPGEALVGKEGRASLALDGDLAALSPFLGEYMDLKGALTGQVSATWEPGRAPTIEGEVSGNDILLTRHFDSGKSGTVAWERFEAGVRSGEPGLALTAGLYRGLDRIVELDLLLPPEREEPLSGTVDISGLNLATLAPFAPTLALLEGELRGRLRLQGTPNRPLAEGRVEVSGGHIVLLENPTELEQLELQLDLLGDRAVLNGQGLLGGGRLTIDGNLSSRPQWRLELALAGDHNEILLPPYTQVRVSEQLQMVFTGGLLTLNGNAVVHEGSLEHEQLPAGAVTLSDDAVEVDLDGNVLHERTPLNMRMSVGLLIEDKFRILGDMVNATLGGDLRLLQEPRQPIQVFGNLNVIGGELRAYQQRLRIERGTISFAGRPENPELNVRAKREIRTQKVVVGLQLRGTLEQAELAVFSDPVMSQGEAMSYLIRGRGLDSGADNDGVVMALSLGSGLVNQSALVTELNSVPGISNLAFGAEGTSEEDTAATVGGYIGERLYLSYGMGIYEPINVLTARLYLQTRLWLEVVSRLENSVDLYYSFDIE